MLGRIKLYMMGLGIMGSLQTNAEIQLFKEYPTFKNSLAHTQLGIWPTPIEKLNNFGNYLNLQNLFIKREDVCAKLFSGNKVRKLEFLLADVVKNNFKTVICYGGVASNNVTATAIFANQLGLDCIALLMDQPLVANLKRNLMLDQYYGCKIFLCPQNRELAPDELQEFLKNNNLDLDPYVIPMGSSNKLGVIGWVNAVFELKAQIEQGLMPEPDYIYISYGSMGTTAGIMLGIKAAGLKTKVKPIQVADPKKYTLEKLCTMIQQTNDFLHEIEPTFPRFSWKPEEIEVITAFYGHGFGIATPQGNHAEKLLLELEKIVLDESYTAKTIAALMHDAKNGTIKPSDVVLYWHTYCSDEFNEILEKVDLRDLPKEFQKYL